MSNSLKCKNIEKDVGYTIESTLVNDLIIWLEEKYEFLFWKGT